MQTTKEKRATNDNLPNKRKSKAQKKEPVASSLVEQNSKTILEKLSANIQNQKVESTINNPCSQTFITTNTFNLLSPLAVSASEINSTLSVYSNTLFGQPKTSNPSSAPTFELGLNQADRRQAVYGLNNEELEFLLSMETSCRIS